MEKDDQRRVESTGQRLKETYEAGYKVGYQAGVEMGRQWLPQSIDLFVYECAVALGHCSATEPGDDGEPEPWPGLEDLLKTLREPVPWPLAVVIAELCRGIFVDPPQLVTDALKECKASPFVKRTSTVRD